MLVIILSWLALNITGEIASVGLVLIWRPLLNVTIGPFAGVLVDYFNRRNLFIAGQVLHTAGIAWLILSVHDRSVDQIGMGPLYVTACIVSLAALLSAPAAQGLLQSVGGKSMTQVVAGGVTAIQAADIFGVLCGGLAIVAVGFGASLAFCAACAVVSMGLAVPLRRDGEISSGGEMTTYSDAIADGFRLVLADHRLLITCLSLALTWSTSHITMALLAAFTLIELGLQADAYGWIDAMWGVGGVAGCMALVWSPRSVVERYLPRFGLLLLAAAMASFSMAQGLWSAMLLQGLMGLAFAVNRTTCDAYILRTVDSGLVGRVRNNVEATIGVISIAIYLSPSLYADASIRTVYVGFAAVLAVAAIALLTWRYRLETAGKTTIARSET